MENVELMAQHEDLDILGVDTPDRCDDSSEKHAANVVGERYQLINLLGRAIKRRRYARDE
jgi:hypothetical protein